MSKTADLHQDYLDYLKAITPTPDPENGPSPDDVPDGPPMTFEEYCDSIQHQQQAAEWAAAGKCQTCGADHPLIPYGICQDCMDEYCSAMSGHQQPDGRLINGSRIKEPGAQ